MTSHDLTRAIVVTPEIEAAVEDLFASHKPDYLQINAMENVRSSLVQSYLTILNYAPPSPSRTRALNNLLDARMLANAAIVHMGNH